MTSTPVLEPAAKEFASATANPPYLFDLGPDKGREVVDDVQSSAIAAPDVEITDMTVPGGPSGAVSVRILRPRDTTGPLPVIVYIHGAGWVFGNAHTHDRLIRELAAGANAAVVFPKLQPLARSEVPDRDRGVLRGRDLGRPARRRAQPRPDAHRDRGRLGRGQHVRRAHPAGQTAR
jgi:hypothetical protein